VTDAWDEIDAANIERINETGLGAERLYEWLVEEAPKEEGTDLLRGLLKAAEERRLLIEGVERLKKSSDARKEQAE
jgi:hypothetical protein